VSFPAAYTISGLPTGTYHVRAWVDADGSGTYSPGEPGGQLSATPLAVSNRVTGCDFALGLDSDGDGLPDWWEMEHFGGATNAVLSADSDADGLDNLAEYLIGTDPGNPDTDGDGLGNGTEVAWGRVSAWGTNDYGQCNVPDAFSNALDIAAGYAHGLALLSEGTVRGWGYDSDGQATVPASVSNAIAISGGYRHSMVLHADGAITAWGTDLNGRITVPASVSNNAIAIAAGMHHSLALLSDGTVVGWGRNSDNQCTVPYTVGNKAAAIAAGIYHSMALLTNGTVVAWGDNTYGQTTVPPSLSNVVAIAAGYNHSLALRADGTVAGWGKNHRGQCSGASNIVNAVAIAAGLDHSLALLSDGTVALWGDNDYGQTNALPSLGAVKAISANGDFSLALSGPLDPLNPDRDGDGLLDGPDLAVDDSDPRYEAFAAAGILYTDNGPDRTFKGEATAGTDPLNPDTSGDGIPDGWLVRHGLDPLDPDIGTGDADQDGLTNYGEMLHGTGPNIADSDGDGTGDLGEILGGSDPLDAQDSANPYGAAVFTLSLGYGPPTGGGAGDGRAVLRLGGLAVPVSHYRPVQGLEIRLPRGRLHPLRLDGARDRLGGPLAASLTPQSSGVPTVLHDPDGIFGPPSAPGGYPEAFAASPVVTINGMDTGPAINLQWPHPSPAEGGILPSGLNGLFSYSGEGLVIEPAESTHGQAQVRVQTPVCHTNWWSALQLTFYPDTNGLSVTGTSRVEAAVHQWPPEWGSIQASILDRQLNPTGELRIAKWEAAYASATSLHANFITNDNDRFFIQVYDESKSGEETVTAQIATSLASDHEITLHALEYAPGWFLSEALMLVSNPVDDELRGSGLSPDLTNRTVLAALGDEVVVNYEAPAPCLSREARADVNARGTITVNLVNLIVGGSPCADAGVIATVTNWTTAAYAQVGVKVNFTITNMPPPSGVDLSEGLAVQLRFTSAGGPGQVDRTDYYDLHPGYKTLIDHIRLEHPQNKHDLHLILVAKLRNARIHRPDHESGYGEPSYDSRPLNGIGLYPAEPTWTLYSGTPPSVPDYVNNMVISVDETVRGLRANAPNLSIMAHELGHVLTNQGDGSADGKRYNIMLCGEYTPRNAQEDVFDRKRFNSIQQNLIHGNIAANNWEDPQ